jgi:hypothetical protein
MRMLSVLRDAQRIPIRVLEPGHLGSLVMHAAHVFFSTIHRLFLPCRVCLENILLNMPKETFYDE